MADAGAWRPVETAQLHAMFARSEWVMIATDLGRVTEGMPFFSDAGLCFWIAARGGNCSDPRYPHSMLREAVTHWQPRPMHPHIPSGADGRGHNEGEGQ